MSKDPAILFYTSDFLGGTFTMSDEQVGRYIRLLCLSHQKGGYLTEKEMLSVCKKYDEDIFVKFLKTDDGRYYNERMLEVINKRHKHSEKQKVNAEKRWKKTDDGNANALPNDIPNNMPKECDGNALAMPLGNGNGNGIRNETGNENETGIIKISFDQNFSLFWSAYPRKEEWDVCREEFTNILKNRIATPHQLITGATAYNAFCLVEYADDYPMSQFIKKPINWLRSKNWLENWRDKIKHRVRKADSREVTNEDIEREVFSLRGKLK